jgi:hypothetical protein
VKGEGTNVNERSRNATGYRGNDKKPSAFLALAIVTMAFAGFGIAGAFVVAPSVAGHVAKALGNPNAEKVSTELAKRLHGVSTPIIGKGTVVSTTSTNWGGYADAISSGQILEAYAVWQVPAISCASHTPSLNDNWVGIDGFSTGTVEQGGTYGYCVSATSGPYYWTWWEFYPYNGIQSVYSGVSPGDWIQAYILYNPYFCYGSSCGVYTITVEDLSNSANSFTVQGNPTICNSNGCESGPDLNAECISESLVGQGLYLPNYGTTTFVTCDAEINGHYSGIGGAFGPGVTVYKITTNGAISGLRQQAISTLSSYDWPHDHFFIKWLRYS